MRRALALSDDHQIDDAGLPIGRRSAPRLRLSLPARLITLSDTRRCILIDLSRTGAQVGLEEPMQIGSDVILQIDRIDQFGTIVRRAKGLKGGLNGVEFEEPLTDEQVIAMRHYAEGFEAEAHWQTQI